MIQLHYRYGPSEQRDPVILTERSELGISLPR